MGKPQATDLFAVSIDATQGVPDSGTPHSVKWSEMLSAIGDTFTTSVAITALFGALGSASAQDVEAFATAAQGTLADSALQDGSIFATTAQGLLADSAIQPAAHALKADISTIYTQTQLDTALALKANAASVYTQSQIDSSLAFKSNVADIYTQTQINNALALKADVAVTYTKTETDAAIAAFVDGAPEALNSLNELAAALGDDPNFATTIAAQIGAKADSATTLAGYNIADAYTITAANAAMAAAIGALSLGTASQSNIGDFALAGQVLTNVPLGAVFTDTVYVLPFVNNSANWNTAYGWGDHGSAGYISGYTVTEGDVTGHQAALAISVGQITATGTADATTYLRGDGSWETPAGGSSDADTLDGYDTSTSATIDTVAVRNSSGDILMRLPRSTYGTTTSTPASTAAIVFRNNNSSDNFHRTMDGTAFMGWLTNFDGSGSGFDADLLDGLHSTSFLNNINTATGDFSTDGNLSSGRGSGGVALTINDGYGNANVTFNHEDGVPEQAGQAGRIEFNADATSTIGVFTLEASASDVVADVPVGLETLLTVSTNNIQYKTYNMWHAANFGKTEIDALGIDADTLDGFNPVIAATADTIVLRDGGGDVTARYFRGVHANISHAQATRSADTMFYSSTDDYIRKNNLTGMRASLGINKTYLDTLGIDAGAVDGINGSSLLRSDAADIKTSGHLTFNDNIYARFGTGGDTEMFHSGAHQYMDLKVGQYFIRDNSTTKFTFERTTGHFTAVGTLKGTALDVGDGSSGISYIRVQKADNNISDHIQFYNGTTRMGEIGVHDTSWLRINQVTNKNIYTPRMFRADGGFQSKTGSAGGPSFTFASDNNTGMYWNSADTLGFSTGGTRRGYWNSTALYVNDVRQQSDRSLKENFRVSPYGLKELLKVKASLHTMIDGGFDEVGFIAQEVDKVMPLFVGRGALKGDPLSLAYAKMVAVAFTSIQQMHSKHERRFNKLEKRIRQLESV